jgi:response regulator RpfG family c-di-GMP phosphodiesterase
MPWRSAEVSRPGTAESTFAINSGNSIRAPGDRVRLSMSTDPTHVPNVLVVEDEMILRMRAVDTVEDAGFCPIEAVNADEAILILESRSDISLLFTDIQMPGSIDGLKLAYAVHER